MESLIESRIKSYYPKLDQASRLFIANKTAECVTAIIKYVPDLKASLKIQPEDIEAISAIFVPTVDENDDEDENEHRTLDYFPGGEKKMEESVNLFIQNTLPRCINSLHVNWIDIIPISAKITKVTLPLINRQDPEYEKKVKLW
mgnify:CR=1 FL=1